MSRILVIDDCHKCRFVDTGVVVYCCCPPHIKGKWVQSNSQPICPIPDFCPLPKGDYVVSEEDKKWACINMHQFCISGKISQKVFERFDDMFHPITEE